MLNTLHPVTSQTSQSFQFGQNEQFEVLRKENAMLCSKISSFEHNRLISQKKIEVLEGELNRVIKENRDLILLVEAERTEKLKLIESSQDITNELTLGKAESHKEETENKRLSQENEELKQELQNLKLEKVGLIKQKQNTSNKLTLAEAKLQALSMQETFINASLAQTVADNARLKEENVVLNKRISEGNGSCVKTVLKDNNQTTKQLLSEFELKIHNKELANHEEIQRYESKISQLNLKVAQLESQLTSK